MAEVLEKECGFECALDKEVTGLKVLLGWETKQESLKDRIRGRIEVATMGVSEKSYDLNLAAILEYTDGTKSELVFHHGASGRGADEAGSVVLGTDDRTGFGKGSDESISIALGEIPENVGRVVLFMNIGGANLVGQKLADVDGVFVQIEAADDCRVLMREEDAFHTEEAAKYCCLAFAALCREEGGWVLRGMARYSDEDREAETLKAFLQK